MMTTTELIHQARQELDAAQAAGELDAAHDWQTKLTDLEARRARDAYTAARNMARCTGAVSATYVVTNTDGTVAFQATYTRDQA